MGYYTQFELEIESGDEYIFSCEHKPETPFCPECGSTRDENYIMDVIQENFERWTGYSMDCGEIESCKWYDWEKDMISISRKFPKTVFRLRGTGEEQPDIWQAFFKNGKHYKWNLEVVYPSYDEGKLNELTN